MEKDVLRQFVEWILNEKENISLCDSIEYEKGDRWVKIGIEVMGTQFNDRSALIENVKEGDPLQILRDPDNFFDRFTLSVCNQNGQELGTMWMNLADVLSPVLDEGFAQIIESHATEVVPLSKREDGAAKPILKMEMTVFLTQEVDFTPDAFVAPDMVAAKEPENVSEAVKDGADPFTSETQKTGMESHSMVSPQPASTGPVSATSQEIPKNGSENVAVGIPVTAQTPVAPVQEHAGLEDKPAVGLGVTGSTGLPETVRQPAMPVVRQKSSRAWIGALVVGLLAWAAVLGGGYYYATTTYIPSQHYRKGYDLYQQEKYTLAADELHRAGTYNGADRLLADCYKKMVSAETEDDSANKKGDNTKQKQ